MNILKPKLKLKLKLKHKRAYFLLGGSALLVLSSFSVAYADIFSDLGKINNRAGGLINRSGGILDASKEVTGILQPKNPNPKSSNQPWNEQIDTQIKTIDLQVDKASDTVDEVNDALALGRSIYWQLSSGNFRSILRGLERLRGVLGIPDPYQARQEGINAAKNDPDAAQAAANVVDRGVASGIAATEVLGKRGQMMLQLEARQVESTTNQASAVVDTSATASSQSIAAAQKSKSEKISQNILQNISQQQGALSQQNLVLAEQNAWFARTSQHQSEQLASLQKIGAGSLLTQNNISATLDQQATSKQIENQSVDLGELQASSTIYLPTLSNSN